MGSATKALGDWWQACAKASEVEKSGHQCWHLHVRFLNEAGDEELERWKGIGLDVLRAP
jgi:hypothetical protein